MDGEGGDEAFTPGHFLYVGDWLKRGRWIRLWRDYRNALPWYRRGMRSQARRALMPNLRTRLGLRQHPSIPDWINDEFLSETRLSRQIVKSDATRYRDSNYTQSRGFPPFFTGMDTRGAAAGVEVRHPLWDSRIVDFMTRIPPEVRLKGGRTKLMLKQALSDLLPQELLAHKPHAAFGGLHANGFRVREVDRLEALFKGSRLGEMGVIDAEKALNAFREYRQGDIMKFKGLMWAFGIEMWLRSDPASLGASTRPREAGAIEDVLPVMSGAARGLKSQETV